MEFTLTILQLITLAFITMMNGYTFCLFYIDKRRAVRRQYRISEKHLLVASYLLGGVGSWVSMQVFRHKTQKPLFKFSVPLAAMITISVVVFVFYS
ncbi:DUF1294 domain-containing protein [Marinilactibacillus piezotolerans]|uniref:DUF1294 domain-containing protein n=1 Tax=Marinilactibacillus piezotolerans TaxID=258723 RepID=UPI00277B5A35|nr:DUF1294 domain-containing protein [Marinilactibacillus piezotolerans]